VVSIWPEARVIDVDRTITTWPGIGGRGIDESPDSEGRTRKQEKRARNRRGVAPNIRHPRNFRTGGRKRRRWGIHVGKCLLVVFAGGLSVERASIRKKKACSQVSKEKEKPK